jgi:hypothetical protein
MPASYIYISIIAQIITLPTKDTIHKDFMAQLR